jgi:PPOX class probable FMN-dependent enzyme
MTQRVDKLRQEYGSPSERSSKKIVSFLTDENSAFIQESPFAVLSSCDADGNCDASPRGGLPGFIKVMDKKTLFIPDIKGNRLFQSFGNFESNPKAALLFLIPGRNRMVRVNGDVSLITKEEISKRNGGVEVANRDENSEYIQGFILKIKEAYHHCPRALNFSDLWNTETILKNKE